MGPPRMFGFVFFVGCSQPGKQEDASMRPTEHATPPDDGVAGAPSTTVGAHAVGAAAICCHQQGLIHRLIGFPPSSDGEEVRARPRNGSHHRSTLAPSRKTGRVGRVRTHVTPRQCNARGRALVRSGTASGSPGGRRASCTSSAGCGPSDRCASRWAADSRRSSSTCSRASTRWEAGSRCCRSRSSP
jgi:hypothetical protein